MLQVEEKNNRIQEILVEMGSDESFFKPRWLDAEQPEEVFNVRRTPVKGSEAIINRVMGWRYISKMF